MTPIHSRLTAVFKAGPVLVIGSMTVWGVVEVASGSDGVAGLRDSWWYFTMLIVYCAFHGLTTWPLADEVLDGGSRFRIRRGRRTVEVPLASIDHVSEGARVLYVTWLGLDRRAVVLELAHTTDLGRRIHFFPADARLPATHKRVGLLHHLRLRAQRARQQGALSPASPR